MTDINNFKVEVSCEYKGETYSVRDNGVIRKLAAYVMLGINLEGKNKTYGQQMDFWNKE